MADSKPTCNQCGAEISWNKTVRDNFGIKGPLEPDESKKHTCDEERKTAYKANKAAEELATKEAKEKAASMGSNNSNNGPKLESVEIYLKGILEESRRQTDLLTSIRTNIESIQFYAKKSANSQEWFEKLFEFRHRNEELPSKEDLGIGVEPEIAQEEKKVEIIEEVA